MCAIVCKTGKYFNKNGRCTRLESLRDFGERPSFKKFVVLNFNLMEINHPVLSHVIVIYLRNVPGG